MTIAPAAECPRLRDIEINTRIHNGQRYFQLSDPLQLSDRALLVPQFWGAILARLDGNSSISDVAAELNLHYGIPINATEIETFVEALDEIYLLDNERYREARQQAVSEFRSEPFRQPIYANQGYPGTAETLKQYLDGFLGALPLNNTNNQTHSAGYNRYGVLSPHIDYPRGGPVYAQVWREAAEAVRNADLVLLLGTDHKGNDPITLTKQHYATPYGVLPTALDVVEDFASIIGEEVAYAGELRHRSEHSLELVAVWMHHVRRGESVELAPMLVGPLLTSTAATNGAGWEPRLRQLTEYVRSLSTQSRVVIVASGDLSHVGPAFGGEPLTSHSRGNVESADRRLLDHLHHANADSFLEEVTGSGNPNNVCGVWPFYVMLRLLEATQGTVTGYDSCSADATDTSAVTICGMVFH